MLVLREPLADVCADDDDPSGCDILETRASAYITAEGP